MKKLPEITRFFLRWRSRLPTLSVLSEPTFEQPQQDAALPARQTNNIFLGLQDSDVDEDALRRQFADWPIEGLGDVIIVRADGTVGRF